jgi:tetratricopeptide (TPR) repeat protein
MAMTTPRKTCFVVMGFGEKVDFATGRKLNLNASYENLIKPAVEAAGLECVRADEIVHSGNINVPMYERILTSDLVIADLSTSNNNAFYELGVRHALRPFTTIIIAEDQFKFPFDIAQITVRLYKHLGDDIGVSEARRFRGELKKAIESILASPVDDSPVYTFLRGLRRLKLPDDINAEGGRGGGPAEALPQDPAPPAHDQTHSVLMQQVAQAKKAKDFATAKALLTSVRAIMRSNNPGTPEDPYIIQQLALVTYKSKLPTPRAALEEARGLLLTLDPATSNDTETLGLWGAVHKRLWDETEDKQSEEAARHLDEAVRGYERGFYLRNDYYNGINLAFLLNVRAAHATSPAEAVADFVWAERVRREVLSICDDALQSDALPKSNKYWVLATKAEALLGAGEREQADRAYAEAYAAAPEPWMIDTTKEQRAKLETLLADSPLKYVKPDAA